MRSVKSIGRTERAIQRRVCAVCSPIVQFSEVCLCTELTHEHMVKTRIQASRDAFIRMAGWADQSIGESACVPECALLAPAIVGASQILFS